MITLYGRQTINIVLEMYNPYRFPSSLQNVLLRKWSKLQYKDKCPANKHLKIGFTIVSSDSACQELTQTLQVPKLIMLQ